MEERSMSTNRNINSTDLEDDDDSIVESLRDNIGRTITVFTQSGGCSGMGFTGLLVAVNCRFIKLITQLPSAPRHPFGKNNDSRRRSCDRDRSRFGTAIIIPISKIVSFVFNEQ